MYCLTFLSAYFDRVRVHVAHLVMVMFIIISLPVFKMAEELPLCKDFLYESLARKDYVLPPYKHPFVTLEWLDGVINQRFYCPHGENFRYRVIPKS